MFIERDVTVTEMFWNQQDLVEGYVPQLINNADASRSSAPLNRARRAASRSDGPRATPSKKFDAPGPISRNRPPILHR